MMRVFCDPRWNGPHGIGRFSREVMRRCGFEKLSIGGQPLDLVDPLRLRGVLTRVMPDHFFSPGFNAPIGKPCSFSLTVHDLIHLECPLERSTAKRFYYELIVKPAIKNAAIVFTVSEFSKARIIAWSGVSEEKIICVGNGVDEAFTPNGQKWRNEKPYLLYVGNQKPHKNVEVLISAFAKSGLSERFELLLTGPVSNSVTRCIGLNHLEGRVHGLGLVNEEVLPSLYRGAHALVMPSSYEGFGLPLIEGMASGTPVISSNKSSLPEVGGNAVRYFDPDDLESFIDALGALEDAAMLEELRNSGLERAKKFNWDRVAKRVTIALENQKL